MIKIVCTSCSKPLSLDESKLPMKEVSFPCPVCKAKLLVDRRTLPGQEETPGGLPSASALVTADSHSDHHEETDGFGSKALLLGVDHPALRQAIKLIGFVPVFKATPEEGRDYYMQEYPPVVVIHASPLTPPPIEAMQPIISLTPSDRRKSFFILVAEGLRTLDGNAAFLYGVNLVVAPRDLGAFQQIYREAHTYHERLYATMTSISQALASGATDHR